MWGKLFLDHPASVNESYLEHAGVAFSFAVRLLYAGSACLVHGIFPGLCKSTGSRTIIELHRTMVTNRLRNQPSADSMITYDVRAFDAVI